MNYLDLHCDTIYECYKKNKSLYKNDLHLDLLRLEKFDKYVQTLAIWIEDSLNSKQSEEFFYKVFGKLKSELEAYNKASIVDFNHFLKDTRKNIIIAIEGGRALGGKVENVEKFLNMGVSIMTLTWNSNNEIGGGAMDSNEIGITPFGKDVVKQMSKVGMLVDVSHASRKLFYDIANIYTKPIVATHSNSDKICNHKRNLTDEQFLIIKQSKGLVGINFYKNFLKQDGNANLEDVYKHIYHFLQLGGENTIAIGSDFDGCELANGLTGVQCIESLAEFLYKQNIKSEIIEKIFYENGYNFYFNALQSKKNSIQ